MSLGLTTVRGLVVAAVTTVTGILLAIAAPVAAAVPMVRGRPMGDIEPGSAVEIILAAMVSVLAIAAVAYLVWWADRRTRTAEIKHLPTAEERERTRKAA